MKLTLEYIHFILLIYLIRLPISEEMGLSMSNDHFSNLCSVHCESLASALE